MAGSILVDVRSAVIDGLATDVKPALDGGTGDINVVYQWREDHSVREWVYTAEGRFNHTPASMRSGRNFRDEVGQFKLVILVAGVDMSQEEASTRALEISAACETWIADRKNNELGVTGLQTLTVNGDGFLNEMYAETGHLAIVDLPIKYTARLT